MLRSCSYRPYIKLDNYFILVTFVRIFFFEETFNFLTKKGKENKTIG